MKLNVIKLNIPKWGKIYFVISNYLDLSFNKKYKPGKEQMRFNIPYIIATLILTDADKPNRKDINSAANSLTPQPPILTGKVIENSIIGVKTKNEK